MNIYLNKILKKGKALFLAYDQGLEHGPTDFNDENIDPEYVIGLAREGGYTGLIVQKGIAEKYQDKIRDSKIPLIIKLNGKTNLVKGDPISRQLCTVEEAQNLGAVAVGYTIYIGSEHEEEMLYEFENIQRNAHKQGMPVIAWIYPRGKSVEKLDEKKLTAYAARVGLEIGADIIKVHFNGSKRDLKWIIQSAGRAKIVFAGGSKKSEKQLLKDIKKITNAGGIGFAIGRNIWQDKKPLQLTQKIKKIIWKNEK
jgi:class I fructose-bisphosphate aldolase